MIYAEQTAPSAQVIVLEDNQQAFEQIEASLQAADHQVLDHAATLPHAHDLLRHMVNPHDREGDDLRQAHAIVMDGRLGGHRPGEVDFTMPSPAAFAAAANPRRAAMAERRSRFSLPWHRESTSTPAPAELIFPRGNYRTDSQQLVHILLAYGLAHIPIIGMSARPFPDRIVHYDLGKARINSTGELITAILRGNRDAIQTILERAPESVLDRPE